MIPQITPGTPILYTNIQPTPTQAYPQSPLDQSFSGHSSSSASKQLAYECSGCRYRAFAAWCARMSWLEVFLLACALAVDAFSVGAVVGLRHRTPRQIFRLSFHFGLFQALFPLVGALASHFVLEHIQAWDHWLVFVVLGALGARMIVNALRGGESPATAPDLTRGIRLVGLSAAVSIDALAAGLLIAATHTPLLGAVLVIGVVASLATAVAMLAAGKLSPRTGKGAEILGGLVLIALGTRTLLTDLGVLP